MRCHYCDRGADLTVERAEITVGLCASHFRERLAELAEEGWVPGALDRLEP